MARKVVGFGEDRLRTLAGARSFERGLRYLNAVSGLDVGDGSVTARVQGTDVYEVELILGKGTGVSGWCDCPYGQEGNFCKHCVAVGLTLLEQAETIPRQRAAARARTASLEGWLTALTRDELLALVREQMAGDRELRRRLELRAATAHGDLDTVGQRILALVDPRPFARYGYVEYADSASYARQVAEAANALRTLTADGQATQAVSLAEQAIEALGKTYDAPSGITHLRIAEELDAAGRDDEALAWAERGLRDTTDEAHIDGRLVDYVCDRYTRTGRAAETVIVRRDRFRTERSLAAYQQLRTAAQVVDCWESEREAALAVLREDARQGSGGGYRGPVLLDALLDDEDLDAAWREAVGGADERQWQQLADLSREARPAQALAVYLRLIDQVKEPTGDCAYERMATLLQGARDCHRALDTLDEFAAYMSALRVELKRRHKLMAILDRHRL